MYQRQTSVAGTVQPAYAAETGRILVVDDDRPFGGFMLAALQSRGHDVEWAGCIADAFATLYTSRYDLVIIDLRLPDGSGLEFLRDATDAGLLANSAAIILTGHDFEEPSDIRVFYKPFDLDPFLDHMAQIVTMAKRRRARGEAPAAGDGHAGSGRQRPAPRRKVELVLYTSASSEKCQRAIRSIQQVLENYERDQVLFTICDLSGNPEAGDADAVIFTPTLVKRGPGPRTWIVGNLDQPELVVDILEVSGVDRKRDRL
ncbi:MAG TPA: response regulator [Vicinamibacterales bacterium]|jgi:CheY-like chemotaxis protein